LANDKQAIKAAKGYGVETRWFTQILHNGLKKNIIKNVDEYTQILDACVNQGLYISKRQRELAIQKAHDIVSKER
jgi:predicted nucleic acid-binding protein